MVYFFDHSSALAPKKPCFSKADSAKTLLHSVTNAGEWVRKTKGLGYMSFTSKAVTTQ